MDPNPHTFVLSIDGIPGAEVRGPDALRLAGSEDRESQPARARGRRRPVGAEYGPPLRDRRRGYALAARCHRLALHEAALSAVRCQRCARPDSGLERPRHWSYYRLENTLHVVSRVYEHRRASRSESGADVSRRRASRAGRTARRAAARGREPWYRQFWPWFLIALPGSVVVAGSALCISPTATPTTSSSTDYYKDGLAINRSAREAGPGQELGIAPICSSRRPGAGATARRGRRHGEPLSLSLRLSHPLEADRDFSVRLERVAPTLYVGALPAARGPNWHWTLEPRKRLAPRRITHTPRTSSD
jgi:hypothetical protein